MHLAHFCRALLAGSLSVVVVPGVSAQEHPAEFPTYLTPGLTFTPGVSLSGMWDSNVALAAPLVLDLARLTAAAMAAGRTGPVLDDVIMRSGPPEFRHLDVGLSCIRSCVHRIQLDRPFKLSQRCLTIVRQLAIDK